MAVHFDDDGGQLASGLAEGQGEASSSSFTDRPFR
jgi:hypothetical protein